MKKRIAMVMALVMTACAFTACGTAAESTAESATEAVTEETVEETTAESETEAVTEETVEETTEETTEEATEEATEAGIQYAETQDTSVCGIYYCDRAKLEISTNDGTGFFITIHWGSSATESAEWDMTGKFDVDHVMHYEGCRSQHVTYAENGEVAETEVLYEGGTGTFVFTDAGVEWHDDKEDAGKDMLFVLAPEENEEETAAEEATEAADETKAAE